MELRKKVVIGALILGASALSWGVYCLYTSRSFVPEWLRPEPAQASGTQDRVNRWIRTSGELRLVNAIPVGYVQTRIVASRSTAPFAYNSTPNRREVFRQVRQWLVQSGRGDEDCRAVALRFVIESGWLRVIWNNNIGNIKSQGHVVAMDVVSAHSGLIYTNIGEATGIHLLVDLVGSLDGYASFANYAAYMRYDRRVLEATWPRALEGYRRGGLEGLLLAESVLGGEGGPRYSSEPSTIRIARARIFWNRSVAMIPEFADRERMNPP